jgi:hypothetical protein
MLWLFLTLSDRQWDWISDLISGHPGQKGLDDVPAKIGWVGASF